MTPRSELDFEHECKLSAPPVVVVVPGTEFEGTETETGAKWIGVTEYACETDCVVLITAASIRPEPLYKIGQRVRFLWG